MPGTGLAGRAGVWIAWYAGLMTEEWELTYRSWLSRSRIAGLVRAPTIVYHLAAARNRDPGLEDEHAAAAGTPRAAAVLTSG